jgi:hypothetical protein
VRTGLVVVGLAITLVGGALVGVLFLAGVGVDNSQVKSATFPVLGGGGTWNSTISLVPAAGGSLTLSWSSTGKTNVSLYGTGPCAPPTTGTCLSLPALVSWSANASGRWSTSGTIEATYVLATRDVGTTNLNFTYLASESYPLSKSPLSPLAASLILVGAGLLLGIGGVAVFLGLFLRGGVYARNPLEPRYPAVDTDDLEDLEDPADDIDR